MAPQKPFGPGRRVVVGVSGGADSTALALLLRSWGDPLAVVVDHGLRVEAAGEAALTAARLCGRGIETRVVALHLRPGPDAGARARAARYAALLAVCRSEGRPDLLVAHHARDQAETQALRARAGSGDAGLAGMAPVSWRGEARLLRPLLAVGPERLHATCREAGMEWVEDPTNHDPATARGALRLGLRPMPPVPMGMGARRAASDRAVAAELAASVALHPGGYAEAGPLSPAAWSALVWTLSGRDHPPPRAAVARLAATGCGTLHGVAVRDGWAFREEAAMAPPVAAVAGACWDGRFVLAQSVPGAEVGALGQDAARLRRRPGPPARVLRTVPALRVHGRLRAVPHLAYPAGESCPSVHLGFRPVRPLAGAAFAAAFTAAFAGAEEQVGGCTWNAGTPCRVQAAASPMGSLGSNDEQFRT